MSRPCRDNLAAIVLALALGGCGAGGKDGDREAAAIGQAPPPPAPATAQPAAGASTVGGDGSAIVLTPLSSDEIGGAELAGELGCSFAEPGAAPLLVAMGDVASAAPSQGIVKVASYVERVAAPGGFDGMLETAVFTGAGKTLRLAVTGPAVGDSESPPRPATLTYQRADGASRVFTGEWTCGP